MEAVSLVRMLFGAIVLAEDAANVSMDAHTCIGRTSQFHALMLHIRKAWCVTYYIHVGLHIYHVEFIHTFLFSILTAHFRPVLFSWQLNTVQVLPLQQDKLRESASKCIQENQLQVYCGDVFQLVLIILCMIAFAK